MADFGEQTDDNPNSTDQGFAEDQTQEERPTMAIELKAANLEDQHFTEPTDEEWGPDGEGCPTGGHSVTEWMYSPPQKPVAHENHHRYYGHLKPMKESSNQSVSLGKVKKAIRRFHGSESNQ